CARKDYYGSSLAMDYW
nr:immunoglobulin heavy chain junction region [Mus musculus]NSM03769.1 immunoglobulin heavy chain junction region [Mus musculus]NSM04163.1 immunoglobulin heavy chain junction region [Mus musculus]NSM04206.1 immunoglobulin heavy chain junction region [Mus musculus]NSM04240.1 immunoglobulin heavy chain junction region [Mus musculus]